MDETLLKLSCIISGRFIGTYKDIDDAGYECLTGDKVLLSGIYDRANNTVELRGYSVKTKANSTGVFFAHRTKDRDNAWIYKGKLTFINKEEGYAVFNLSYFSVGKGGAGTRTIDSIYCKDVSESDYKGSIVLRCNYNENKIVLKGVYADMNNGTGSFESGEYTLEKQ